MASTPSPPRIPDSWLLAMHNLSSLGVQFHIDLMNHVLPLVVFTDKWPLDIEKFSKNRTLISNFSKKFASFRNSMNLIYISSMCALNIGNKYFFKLKSIIRLDTCCAYMLVHLSLPVNMHVWHARAVKTFWYSEFFHI